uniref:Uncharacterized protein n=1 Tax=Chromera velia CCMP2878 TaxID=1169474 RepID=A0A0G4I7N4_9ALVE|eukprot:Cvel_11697.t1-p1 / transcript=Cvel_11697.t1 / gene=Cvel_11697 / organism=Chromera_velia_CCMP2878 / gene_product=hypothetical protein / transcript_product=hypothetical protein / location=Cvel_scaffold742:12188-13147(-) / protein_length=206 / sequence_SO=supercontig / SO=protein_coding / is_pseudo=false
MLVKKIPQLILKVLFFTLLQPDEKPVHTLVFGTVVASLGLLLLALRLLFYLCCKSSQASSKTTEEVEEEDRHGKEANVPTRINTRGLFNNHPEEGPELRSQVPNVPAEVPPFEHGAAAVVGLGCLVCPSQAASSVRSGSAGVRLAGTGSVCVALDCNHTVQTAGSVPGATKGHQHRTTAVMLPSNDKVQSLSDVIAEELRSETPQS